MFSRLSLFACGLVLGVAGVFVYVWIESTDSLPKGRPLPEDPPISITLGEPFLTALVRHAAADTGVSVSGIVVETAVDSIVVKGNLEVLGRQTVATAILRPVLRDGRLHIAVVSTDFGEFPLPLERVLEEQVNARIGAFLADLPVTVTGVIVGDAGLIVTCRVDLDRLP